MAPKTAGLREVDLSGRHRIPYTKCIPHEREGAVLNVASVARVSIHPKLEYNLMRERRLSNRARDVEKAPEIEASTIVAEHWNLNILPNNYF